MGSQANAAKPTSSSMGRGEKRRKARRRVESSSHRQGRPAPTLRCSQRMALLRTRVRFLQSRRGRQRAASSRRGAKQMVGRASRQDQQ